MNTSPRHIYIIESIDPKNDSWTGSVIETMLHFLIKELKAPDKVSYFYVVSRQEFMSALQTIRCDCEINHYSPIIHFSMEGNDDRSGLYLKNSDEIPYIELCKHLAPINTATNGSLMITMHVCMGCNIVSWLDPNLPRPFACVLGSAIDMDIWEPLDGFIGFYTKLISSSDLKLSIQQIKIDCPYYRNQFHFISKRRITNILSEKMLENFKRKWIKQYGIENKINFCVKMN